MCKVILVTFCLFLSAQSFAQSSRAPTPEEQQRIDEYNKALSGEAPTTTEPTPIPGSTPSAASIKVEVPPEKPLPKMIGLINYAPFDLFIPSKFGATFGWRFTSKTSLELEYLRGALSVPFLFKSLGGMTDQRLSLAIRSHFGQSSFNYFYGIGYNMFQIKLGNQIIDRAVPHSSDFDEIQLNSVGFVVGLGNRWVIQDNFVVGVDWGLWAQPLVQTKKKTEFLRYVSDADRGHVSDAINFVSDFPRLSFLKISAGMTF